MDFSRCRLISQEADDNISGGQSSRLGNSSNSTLNLDSEYNGAISVRDMIKRYDSNWNMDANNATCPDGQPRITQTISQSRGTLRSSKSSSFSSLRHYAESPPSYGLGVRPRDCNDKNGNINCCKNCTACRCCQNRSHKSSVAIKAAHSNESIGNPNVYDDVIVVGKTKTAATLPNSIEFKDDFGTPQPSLNTRNVVEKNRLQSNDSIEEATCHPIETSYQSKTTIAKTAGGVRIIIDIFFDQEQQCVNATDVLGSRVETDIPQSRILNEFQQQATAGATPASASPRN